jgi:hypothetical protein
MIQVNLEFFFQRVFNTAVNFCKISFSGPKGISEIMDEMPDLKPFIFCRDIEFSSGHDT